MDLKKLKVNPSNPRQIKEKDFEKLKKSVGSFTKMLEVRPIAYDDDGVIWGGNMRYEALKALDIELKPEYFKELKGYTLEEKKEFAIRDNVEFGEWDDDVLANEWGDLPLDEWGIDTAGWKSDEVIEDEAPPLPEEPKSKLGEVYELGRHRLMCGDSTKIEDVEKLMNGQKADMVFTDPPYNLKYTGTGDRRKGAYKKYWDVFKYDDVTDDEFEKFLDIYNQNIKCVIKDVCSIYEWIDWRQFPRLFKAMSKYFHVDQVIVWDKTFIKLGGNYRNQHELLAFGYNEDINDSKVPYISLSDQCIYAKNNKKVAKWYGGRKESNIWYKITDASFNYVHPTQKPVELAFRAIRNSSERVDTVLDLFGGSGSTLIACEQLDRTCYMMELDPKYCDVIRERYSNFVKQ